MATKAKAKAGPGKPKPPIKQKTKPGKSRLLAFFLWTTVFLLVLVGIDQLLVRVPASHPAHVAVAGFYRDLRGRVLGLAAADKPAPAAAKAKAAEKPKVPQTPASIEAVIDQHQAKPAAPAKAPPPPAPAKPATPEKPVVTAKPAPLAPVKPAAAAPAKPAPAAAKSAAPVPPPGEPKPRYVYPDEQGTLHFAETLAEVPEQYRGKAKVLGE